MKLHELLEDYEKKPTKKYSGRFKKPQHRSPVSGEKGKFSRVKADVKDFSRVHKYNYIPVQDLHKYDPYWLYVDYVVGGELNKQNPYFPKFYVSQTIEDKDGLKVRKLTMERLHDWSELTNQELIQCFTKMYNVGSNLVQDVVRGNEHIAIELFGIDLEVLAESGNTRHTNTTTEIKDKKLLEATYELSIMLHSFNRYYTEQTNLDIHTSNIMIRKENNRIQPVIIDPFFNKGSL